MPVWWEPQLGPMQRNPPILAGATDAVARSRNEIWIGGFPVDSEDSIVRYDATTREIQGYVLRDASGRPFIADDLLVTRDNTLWALLDSTGDRPSFSALAKYDPSKDEFTVVADQEGLLTQTSAQVVTHPRPPQALLAQAPDGRIVVGMNGGIYDYDPGINQARTVLANSSGFAVTSFAVSRDGHIWFVTKADNSIRELNATSGTISDYGPPPGSDPSDPYDQLSSMRKPLEIDSKGRIWVSDFGWLGSVAGETRYVWHPVARSPVFISIYDPEYRYLWERPFRVYQSSGGDIWFVAFRTTVRFNPESNSWCWSATRSGPMTEDQNGKLWLVDSQIYRYGYRHHP